MCSRQNVSYVSVDFLLFFLILYVPDKYIVFAETNRQNILYNKKTAEKNTNLFNLALDL